MIDAAVKEPFCTASFAVGDWAAAAAAATVSEAFLSGGFGRSFFTSFLESLTGAAGTTFSTSGAALVLSFSKGDSGRLGAGVELAVASVAVDFFVFFFRPMIGACTSSSGTTFSTVSSLF